MKVGRNDPCPCGSGKKYKKCCLNKEKQPQDLLYLRISAAYDKMIDNLLDFAEKTLGPEGMALAFGDFMFWEELPSPQDAFREHSPIFLPWLLFDWTYEPDDDAPPLKIQPYQTVASLYASSKGSRLESLQSKLLEAICESAFSFFEVISSRPGEGFMLRDILTGVEMFVTERKASQGTKPGDILFARVIEVDHLHMMITCAPFLMPPRLKAYLIRFRQGVRRVTGSTDPEALFEYQEEIRSLYLDIHEALSTPPMLCNMDGDPILFHTIHYEIDDPQAAFEALHGLCSIQDAEGLRSSATLDPRGRIVKIKFPWTARARPFSRSLDNITLGSISIDHQTMTVFVNSRERAEAIKAEIEARLGPHARHRATEVESPWTDIGGKREVPRAHRSGQDEDLMKVPEVRERLRETILSRWRDWIDEEIPALGGRTPRQAARTPSGREGLEALLLDAERYAENDGQTGDFQREGIENVRKMLKLGRWRKGRDEDEEHQIKRRLREVKSLITDFGRERLKKEYTRYALRLSDMIAQSEEFSLARGRVEIWAAAIVYVIAQLNFLFDPGNEDFLPRDEILSFFGTKKSTTSSRASQIRDALDLFYGHEGLTKPEIARSLRFFETEDGFIVPASMLEEGVEEDQGDGSSGRPNEASRGYDSRGKERKRQKGERRRKDFRQLSLFDLLEKE